jgi:hypothetical protein
VCSATFRASVTPDDGLGRRCSWDTCLRHARGTSRSRNARLTGRTAIVYEDASLMAFVSRQWLWNVYAAHDAVAAVAAHGSARTCPGPLDAGEAAQHAAGVLECESASLMSNPAKRKSPMWACGVVVWSRAGDRGGMRTPLRARIKCKDGLVAYSQAAFAMCWVWVS